MEKDPEEKLPEIPTQKKKRAFTWTEKRKEAWAKAQAARANNIEIRKEAKKQPPEPLKRVVRRYIEVSESEEEEAPVIVKKKSKKVPEPEPESTSESESEISEITEPPPPPRPQRPPQLYV